MDMAERQAASGRGARASLANGGWVARQAALAAAAVLSAAAADGARIVVLHPLDGAVFPLEFTPPDFLWEDPSGAQQWVLVFRFASGTNEIRVLSDGVRPPLEVDDRCRREDGEA